MASYTKYIIYWVNPGPTVYISGLNFGRAAVLLALFVVMITAVNTRMYEVWIFDTHEVIYCGHEFPVLYILLGRFQHTGGMYSPHFRIECSPVKELDKSYCKLLLDVIKETKILNCDTHIIRDRDGTLVKVLCYKSEGRWFDPRWCHWNFSLT